jgi:hypothetical protein
MASLRWTCSGCLVLAVLLAAQLQTAEAWGLNADVDWKNISSTVQNQRFMKLNSTKPVMMVVHKSW